MVIQKEREETEQLVEESRKRKRNTEDAEIEQEEEEDEEDELISNAAYVVIDESKTHIFLSPFFKYISGLKSSFKCKIMELSPRFMFCRELMKRSKIRHKRS